MNLSEKPKVKILRPMLHTTLTVLHNLWLKGHLETAKLGEILIKDYDVKLEQIEQDYMHVETLDGLSTSSIGDVDKYRKV